MSITQMWRGSGRRRMPDALAAARNELRTYRAACEVLQDERDQLARRIASLEETLTYDARSLEQARTENAQLRHELRGREQALAEAAQDNANLERQVTFLRSELANARAVHVPAPADAGARELAGVEDTAAWDMREARGHLLLLAAGPNGEAPSAAVDAPEPGGVPTVAMPVPLDEDDTVTLPRPLVAPVAVVHPIPPDPDSAPTVAVVTLAQRATGPAEMPTLPPEFAKAGTP